MADEDKFETIAMAAEIVSAYVSNNKIEPSELSALIQTIYASLLSAEQPATVEEQPEKPSAPQIKKSITPDALISFVDGKPYKTLKRHLATQGLTVDEYKAKFGLSSDYPTTAPNYSAHRSAMAKSSGLGTKVRNAAKSKAPDEPRSRSSKAV